MSSRRTLGLATAFMSLAVYFALFEGLVPERPAPAWQLAAKLVDCGGEVPTALAVSSSRGRAEARREGARWVTSAGALGAASFASLADALCRLPVLDSTANPALTDFGLDPPRATIEATWPGRSIQLAIGSASPAGNRGYAKLAGRAEVLTVGAELASAVERVTHAGSAP